MSTLRWTPFTAASQHDKTLGLEPPPVRKGRLTRLMALFSWWLLSKVEGRTPSTASATITTHLGELIQGEFTVRNGIIRGLITLPCPTFTATATATIYPGGSGVVVTPCWASKAAKAGAMTLNYLDARNVGVHIRLHSDIPMEIGAGSSTGDVVASIEATAKALGSPLPSAVVGHLTVETEGASDPTMHRDGLVRLFAQRVGLDIEVLDASLPPLEVVSIADGAGVNTNAYPPAKYSADDGVEFDALLARMRRAVAAGDATEIGAIATRSAQINQKFLPKPHFRKWLSFATAFGSVGIAVSHSGSAVSFLFDGLAPDAAHKGDVLAAALKDDGFEIIARFNTAHLQSEGENA